MSDIERMEAGRALDRLIAERVMGWTQCNLRRTREYGGVQWTGWGVTPDGVMRPLPGYSTDIAAAWEAVEAVVERTKLKFRCGYGRALVSGEVSWWAFFGDPKDSGANADTAPLAICRAALLAVGTPDPEPERTA